MRFVFRRTWIHASWQNLAKAWRVDVHRILPGSVAVCRNYSRKINFLDPRIEYDRLSACCAAFSHAHGPLMKLAGSTWGASANTLRSSACRRKWRLIDTDLCPCGETQTMCHIVESCPLTKLNGGLSRLHSADEDTVSWLTNYGKWHAYEKKKTGHWQTWHRRESNTSAADRINTVLSNCIKQSCFTKVQYTDFTKTSSRQKLATCLQLVSENQTNSTC